MAYAVYQKRYTVEALKTKALLLAACDPEKAGKAAEEYLRAVVPVSPRAEARAALAREQELERVANMEPIHLRPVTHGR